MNVYVIMWFAVFISAVITEYFTASFVCLWFAPSAVICAILAAVGVPNTVVIVLFFLISVVLLMLFRKMLLEYMYSQKKRVPSELDIAVGSVGTVGDEIDNFRSQGSVVINGKKMPARSADNKIIPSGTPVTVEKIDGIILICRRK